MNEQMIPTIKKFVRMGCYSPPEIAEIISQDIFDEYNLDIHEVETAINEEIKQKRLEEANWPERTDCDKLDHVFQELNHKGILALHNAGYNLSQGLEDVVELYHRNGGEESGIVGYCYYHTQDLEAAVQGHGLSLAFGDIHGTEAKGLEVGRRIVNILKQAGFTADWDETIQTRIFLPEIVWLCRS